jgi:NhaA family Na+:H+ antiporter
MLSFNDPTMIEEAKLAILIGSLLSGVIGSIYLTSVAGKKTNDRKPTA